MNWGLAVSRGPKRRDRNRSYGEWGGRVDLGGRPPRSTRLRNILGNRTTARPELDAMHECSLPAA